MISLILVMAGCCCNSGDLNVCAEIDAATNDAGACVFTPTHPPLNLDSGMRINTSDGGIILQETEASVSTN